MQKLGPKVLGLGEGIEMLNIHCRLSEICSCLLLNCNFFTPTFLIDCVANGQSGRIAGSHARRWLAKKPTTLQSSSQCALVMTGAPSVNCIGWKLWRGFRCGPIALPLDLRRRN